MTHFSSICTVGLTGEALASDACGGHVRPEVKVLQAGPVKQEVFSVRKNPLDESRGEVNLIAQRNDVEATIDEIQSLPEGTQRHFTIEEHEEPRPKGEVQGWSWEDIASFTLFVLCVVIIAGIAAGLVVKFLL